MPAVINKILLWILVSQSTVKEVTMMLLSYLVGPLNKGGSWWVLNLGDLTMRGEPKVSTGPQGFHWAALHLSQCSNNFWGHHSCGHGFVHNHFTIQINLEHPGKASTDDNSRFVSRAHRNHLFSPQTVINPIKEEFRWTGNVQGILKSKWTKMLGDFSSSLCCLGKLSNS